MLSGVLICVFLGLGQTDQQPAASPDATIAAPESAATANAPAPADRWFLMQTLQGTWPGWLLDSNRLALSGWTDISFTASSDRSNNYPQGFNDRADQFLLQQEWIRFERAVLTSGTTDPSWGFRTDLIIGSDYSWTLARGLLDRQLTGNNGMPDQYGIDPVQFYAEAYFPTVAQGLDIKVGRFFALYGFEQISSVDNTWVSHAFDDLFDPFTHTGILATLALTNTWTVQTALVTGSDVFVGPGASPTFTGTVKWAPPLGRDWVQLSVILGDDRYDQAHDLNNLDLIDFMWTHKFDGRLTESFEATYGFENNVPALGAVQWWGLVNYLTYQLTPTLNETTRLELFDDVEGERTGYAGVYWSATTGLTFKLTRNIWLRPELRYSYNGDSRPFENQHGEFTAVSDFVVRW